MAEDGGWQPMSKEEIQGFSSALGSSLPRVYVNGFMNNVTPTDERIQYLSCDKYRLTSSVLESLDQIKNRKSIRFGETEAEIYDGNAFV